MDRRNEDTALLALRGGLRGRFRRSFDSMENAFEVLQDRLQHAVNPGRARRADAAARGIADAADLPAAAGGPGVGCRHGGAAARHLCAAAHRPAGAAREFCSILQEEAAQYALPFTVTLQADGLDVLPTTGDVSLLNGLLTNLVSNTLAADRAAHIMLLARRVGSATGTTARVCRPMPPPC